MSTESGKVYRSYSRRSLPGLGLAVGTRSITRQRSHLRRADGSHYAYEQAVGYRLMIAKVREWDATTDYDYRRRYCDQSSSNDETCVNSAGLD